LETLHPNFMIAIALAAGVLAQSLARHIRVPGIVLLLLAGVALGPDGLGWIAPHALGEGLYTALDIAVAVILFEGGLNLQFSRLRREQLAIRRLLIFGPLVTLAGACLAVTWLLDWPPAIALLFGSLVIVTGPTVVTPLIHALRLRPRVATVLEAEGVLIDPVGALIAVLVLSLVLAPDLDSARAAGVDLVARLGLGLVAGVVTGFLLAKALQTRRLVPQGLENIFSLATVLLLFQGSEQMSPHSGILAVTAAGAVVGNRPTRVSRDLREFKDQLTVLLIGLLFVLLAADVRYEQVAALGLGGLGVVAALVLVVRPVAVWISTFRADLSVRERLFIAWVAPRGIVAAAIASLTAGALDVEGVPGGSELRALVFLTIGCTVLLAGLTAGPVASWLGVRLPDREKVAILGAHGLGIALAEQLRAGGTPVVFIDSNPQNCRRVEEAGFPVVYGDALEERTLQRAQFTGTRVAVGLTANKTVNAVFASRAADLFSVPEGLVAVEGMESGFAKELFATGKADVAFDGPHDMERWDVRHRRGSIVVEQRRFSADAAKAARAARAATEEKGEKDGEGNGPAIEERFVILTLTRGARTAPMAMSVSPADGDLAAIAIHEVEGADARERLLALGWLPVDVPAGEVVGEAAVGPEAKPADAGAGARLP